MVAVAYKSVPAIVISLEDFWSFGKVIAIESWSLTRGGRKGRFDCIRQFFSNLVMKRSNTLTPFNLGTRLRKMLPPEIIQNKLLFVVKKIFYKVNNGLPLEK